MTNQSGQSGSGGGNQEINPNQERKKTPRKFKVAKDNRSQQGAGQYPYYFCWKSRSGHTISMDDTKGNETVTIQHRGGTAIQMMKDGALHITAHNSRYDITFGENRMTISGAQDITVKGDASLRVYGDYNVTCHKDYNLTVMGNLNITAKNKNQHIRGNKDTQMKNETKKIEGSSFKMARGAITSVSQGAHTIGSQGEKMYIGAASGLHTHVSDGDHTMNVEKGDMYAETKQGKFDAKFSDGQNEVKLLAKEGKLDQTADKDIKVESKQQSIKVKAMQDIGVESTSSGIQMKSQGDIQHDASGNIQVKAGGDASVEGSTTHVSGQTVHVKGSTTTNIDGPSGLNLNGGLSQLFSGQLNFDFASLTSAAGIPDISGGRAEQPQEEPDLTSEINQWV